MPWGLPKSVKVPGGRVNLGKKGITSVNVGSRKRSVNVGKKGAKMSGGWCCMVPVIAIAATVLTLTFILLRLVGYAARASRFNKQPVGERRST
jgi:hypothetical protein